MNKIKSKILNIASNIKYALTTYPFWYSYIENSFKIVLNKKVRSYFVLPKVKFEISSVIGCQTWAASIFGLSACGISWKDKYSEVSFESEPFIQLNLFGICFVWKFVSPFPFDEIVDAGYWESIVSYYNSSEIKNNKKINLFKLIEDNTWGGFDDDTWKRQDNTKILTPLGLKRYNEDFASYKQEEEE